MPVRDSGFQSKIIADFRPDLVVFGGQRYGGASGGLCSAASQISGCFLLVSLAKDWSSVTKKASKLMIYYIWDSIHTADIDRYGGGTTQV